MYVCDTSMEQFDEKFYMYIYWNANKWSDMANCSERYSMQQQTRFALRRAADEL